MWVPLWNSVWFCLACASCHIPLLSVLIMVQITGLMKSGQIAQLVLRQAELCINAQNHRKWSSALGWREFKDCPAPIPGTGRDTVPGCSKIHLTHPLNTSRNCESTTSLGNLFHCFPHPIYSNLNLPSFRLRTLDLCWFQNCEQNLAHNKIWAVNACKQDSQISYQKLLVLFLTVSTNSRWPCESNLLGMENWKLITNRKGFRGWSFITFKKS